MFNTPATANTLPHDKRHFNLAVLTVCLGHLGIVLVHVDKPFRPETSIYPQIIVRVKKICFETVSSVVPYVCDTRKRASRTVLTVESFHQIVLLIELTGNLWRLVLDFVSKAPQHNTCMVVIATHERLKP